MRSLKYSILFYSNLGPHAGYRYCGACAAHAYSQIDPTHVKRVFILGPSHHYRLNGCAVSDCTKYATPLYDLTVSFFIELLNNKLRGLSPPGGLVSPTGGFASLLFDQGVP